ncbi:MAG: prepilin-type N-terminal cleavage/methylation domain-containing protein [Desulfobacterales bacterium]|jgi:type IV pilus assembly protein PilW
MMAAMLGNGFARQDLKTTHAQTTGFTLVEVLLSIAIFSIVFGTIFRTFDTFGRSYTKENVKAGIQQKARIGIELMGRDIRLAGLDPLDATTAGFIAANTNSSSIRFTADLNYDGDILDAFEDITYNLNGDRLEQTSDLGTGMVVATLMDNVTDLTFTYLDAGDTAITLPLNASTADQITSVLISLTVQRPSGRDGQISRTYTTRVRCRNR